MNPPAPAGKVFGIGLPRTGTASLAAALLLLGFRTAHCVFDPRLYDLGDAFVDTPVFADYPVLDRQFPGSRFILTTRPFDAWYDSVRQALGFRLASLAEMAQPGDRDVLDRRCWEQTIGSLAPDAIGWRSRVAAHEAAAQDHFRERPGDLLVLDLAAAPDSWASLSAFLGRAKPAGAFPHANRHTATDWWRLVHPLKLPSTLPASWRPVEA